MFLKLKSLKNGSAGTSTVASYDTLLANPDLLIGLESVQVTDTLPGTPVSQGAEGNPVVINTVRLNYGESLNEDVYLKAFYGPQAAPAYAGGGGAATLSIPVVNQATAVAETWTITQEVDANHWAVAGTVHAVATHYVGAAGTTVINNGYFSATVTGSTASGAGTFTVVVKSSLTTFAGYLASENYTGGPVYTAVTYKSPAFGKFNKIINVTEQSSSSVISYVNPMRVALVKTFGAYYLGGAPGVSGGGNGTMSVPVIAPEYAAVNTYTVTFLSPTAYQVTNSASVVLGTGTIGTGTGDVSYFNSQAGVSFTITNGTSDFVKDDSFSFTTTAGVRLVTDGEDNADLFSSAPLATWATGLGALDLELIAGELITD